MGDTPLSRAERSLTWIAEQHRRDQFLIDLIEAADDGAGPVVGLLLNGMVVYGALASPRAIAEQIDSVFERYVRGMAEPPEGVSAEEWADTQERIGRIRSGQVDQYDKDRKALRADMEAAAPEGEDIDWDAQPGDLTRRAIAYETRTSLTLRDAGSCRPLTSALSACPQCACFSTRLRRGG